jgi:hypothetical protein
VLVIVEGEEATDQLEVVGGRARQVLVGLLGSEMSLHHQRIPH